MMHAGVAPSSPPAFVPITRSDVRWIVRDDCQSLVAERLFDMLRHHDQFPQLTLVRENNVRASFFMRLPGPDAAPIFVKRYKQPGRRAQWKYLVVPPKAVAEWRNLLRCAACGLPVPRPIALGIQQTGLMLQDSCLMTEAVLPAQPLNEFFAQQRTLRSAEQAEADNQLLAVAVARLAAAIHNAGIFYRDLHAGNILIKTAGDRGYQLFLIDLHRAWRPVVLLQWMRLRDVAQLWNSLPALTAERELFIEEYLRASARRQGSAAAFSRKLETIARRLERRRINSRSKRCLVNSTAFEVHKTMREDYFGRRDVGRQTVEKLLQQVRGPGENRSRVLKQSEQAILTTHEPGGALPRPVCVKHYVYRGIKYAVKSALVASRARKSWVAGHKLLVRGIATPLPLALVERKCGPFIYESFLITEWLADAVPLNDYVLNQHGRWEAHETRRRFIQALAETVRALHEKGIYHADLKSTNILVRAEGAAAWRFYFIDLERVRCKRRLRFRERANNLAQINASVARCMSVKDRLQFFRFYAKDTQLFSERKKYYQEILKISRTKNTEPFGVTFTS